MFHEISKAIGDIMKDDVTLSGLLSSANAIYYGINPDVDIRSVVPAVRFYLVGEIPDTNRSALGVHQLRYQIDAIAETPTVCDSILGRLDVILPIPFKVSSLSTASWDVHRLHRLSSGPIQLETERSGAGGKLHQWTTDWTLTALRKT